MAAHETVLIALQLLSDTAFGTVFVALLAGIPASRDNVIRFGLFIAVSWAGFASAFLLAKLPVDVNVLYFACVHLPLVLLIVVAGKRPPMIALAAFFFGFLLLTPRGLFAALSVAVVDKLDLPLGEQLARRVGWALNGPIIAWPVLRFLVPPLRELINGSKGERLFLLCVAAPYYVLAQVTRVTLARNDATPSLLSAGILALFTLAFCLGLAMYARKVRENQEQRASLAAYSARAEALGMYTESLAAYLEETARQRHDQRHMMVLIDSYASRGDLGSIRAMVGENLALLDSAPVRVAADPSVNAIVGLFAKRAEARGVELRVSGCALDALPLPSQDLCLLLSNLLENAVEAAAAPAGAASASAGHRVVTISVSHNPSQHATALIARNPCGGAVPFGQDGLPESERGSGHGYGTRSMARIVRKHGGACSFKADGGNFCFTAVFRDREAYTAREAPAATGCTAASIVGLRRTEAEPRLSLAVEQGR